MTDPELVTASNVPQEVLLARVAESIPPPASGEGDSEMSQMELADCPDPRCVDGLLDNVALVELVHTALFLR